MFPVANSWSETPVLKPGPINAPIETGQQARPNRGMRAICSTTYRTCQALNYGPVSNKTCVGGRGPPQEGATDRCDRGPYSRADIAPQFGRLTFSRDHS